MTNWDINNRKILQTGAMSIGDLAPGETATISIGISLKGQWCSMESAPRDGTWVEIKNCYGVAPSYSIARWTTHGLAHSSDGLVPYEHSEPQWSSPDGGGFVNEGSLFWRPYEGDVENYIDPTNGAQNSPAYWRGAIAAKHGLPIDYFEATTAYNELKNEVEKERRPKTKSKKRPWWKFWDDWDFG